MVGQKHPASFELNDQDGERATYGVHDLTQGSNPEACRAVRRRPRRLPGKGTEGRGKCTCKGPVVERCSGREHIPPDCSLHRHY